MRLLTFLLLMCCGGAAAADWPCYRGPEANGVAAEAAVPAAWGAAGLKKLWSVPLGDGGGGVHAGPAVAGGKVYVLGKTADKDVLYAFDAAKGTEAWKFEYAAPGESRTYGSGPRATPAVAEGRVFILSRRGLLHALDAATGTLVWSRDLGKDFDARAPIYGHSAAPLFAANRLIVQPGGTEAGIVALDPATGRELWRANTGKTAYAAPQLATLAGTQQVLAFLDTGLCALDPEKGGELWRFEYRDTQAKNIPAPLVLQNRVIVCNRTRGFTALKPFKTDAGWKVEVLWTQRKEAMHFSSPVPGDGVLYGHDGSGRVKCLDTGTGAVRWSLAGLGREQAQLVRLGAKHLLAQLDDGQIALLEDQGASGRELARFQAVGAQAFSAPAVAAGRLYVRDHRALGCFALTQE